MAKLYSQMTREELESEMKRLQAQGHAALESEQYEEMDVLERKFYLALSYTLDRESIQIGTTYRLVDTTDLFEVTRKDGVMAWGYRNRVPIEEAYPIAMLVDKDAPYEGQTP